MPFLRAERRADGARSYRFVSGQPLSTDFGKDLYVRLFGEPASEPEAA